MHRGQKLMFSKALYGLLPVVTNAGAGIRKTQANVMMKKEEWRLKEKWFESSTHATIWRIIYEACVMKMIMCSVILFYIIGLWSWKLFLVAAALCLFRVLLHFLQFQSRILSCCLVQSCNRSRPEDILIPWYSHGRRCQGPFNVPWLSPACFWEVCACSSSDLEGADWLTWESLPHGTGEVALGPVIYSCNTQQKTAAGKQLLLVKNCHTSLLSSFPNLFTPT